MALQYQPYVQQLDDLTFTVGTTQTAQELDLKKLEKKLYKEAEIANVLGFCFEFQLTPTFTTAPTVVGHNASMANLYFYDGSDALFDGNGNDMRMFESMENGWSEIGEAITQTSTNPRFWARFLPMGPLDLAGSPSDYMISCAELGQGAKLRILPSVLTDISADTTAATLVVRTAAILGPSGNQLRIGPKYQRAVKPIAGADTNIADEALYAYIAAVNGSAYDAFTAADFSKVTVKNTKRGRYVDSVDAELLARSFNVMQRPGLLGAIQGERRDDTYDVAYRDVNFASATALAAKTNALQPIIWAPHDCRLSKLRVRNDSDDTLTISFSGGQGANGSYLVGRFLPHTGDSVMKRVAKAASVLGMTAGKPAMKTLNKRAVKLSPQAAKYGVYYAQVA